MTEDYTPGVVPAGDPTVAPTRTSVLQPPAAPDLDSQGSDTSGGGSGGGAKDKVKNVAGSAGDAAGSVMDEARSGARDVKQEAQRQVRDLWGQARGELSDQTSAQQQRLAGGLRSFGDQLDQMASAPEEPGVASDLARDLSRRAADAGQWLESHGPEDLLEEVRSFARRRPGAFLLAAAGAGLLVGRLTRALKDSTSDGSASQSTGSGADGVPVAASDSFESATPLSSYEGTSYTGRSYESTPTTGVPTGGGL